MTNDYPAGSPFPPAEPEPALAGYPPPTVPVAYGQQGHYGQYGPAPGQLSPYPPPMPPVWTKPSPMPDGPREYQQMLRGPRHRWWRPLLALLLVLGIALPLMLLAYFPVVLAGALAGVSDPFVWAGREIVNVDDLGPGGFFYVNLSLIVLIPAAGLSIWIAHRIRPRFLSSVAGGIRWRWLVRCLAVAVPVWAVYLGVSVLLEPEAGPRPAQWGLLLVIVLLLTPLQAAGEEYLFRGWIMQNVGSWFRHPLVGLVVALVVSVVAFSAAHGSPNIWILADLGVFALTAGLLTWRTGGLEAGIAIHAVNNIGVFFTVILLGGWKDAFVSASSTSTPAVFAVSLLVHAVALALILWQAKRAGIQRRYQPAVPAAPVPPPAHAGYPPPPYGQLASPPSA